MMSDVIELPPLYLVNGRLSVLQQDSALSIESHLEHEYLNAHNSYLGQHLMTNSTNGDSEIPFENPKKRKGGWPKGKKRKQDPLSGQIPKAPVTGYVLFLNERRKWYKANHPGLEFASVTKLLGKEWTNLEMNEKQKYLEKAEADKKRYREELGVLRNKNIASLLQKNVDESEVNLENDRNNNEESGELYCRICDQLFISLHNKNEHLYGKHHRQMLAEKSCQQNNSEDAVVNDSPKIESTSLGSLLHQKSVNCSATNINQAILDFIQLSFERMEEIKTLKDRLNSSKRNNHSLRNEAETLQQRESSLRHELEAINTNKTHMKEQLETLRMVPSLFGVINFQQ